MANQFRLIVKSSYITYTRDFCSLKVMNQFISRNRNGWLSHDRLVYDNGRYEPFSTIGNNIITYSRAKEIFNELQAYYAR